MKFARSMALLILDQSAHRRLVFGPPSNPGGPQGRGKKKLGTSHDQQQVQRRVLVVEDNLDSLHSLVALLRSEGHKVEYAINGYAAMTIAEEFQPEVVLLDLGLPGVDGYRVARWLKVQPGLEASTIIAITGYGTDADRAKSRAAGCEHHLAKPYDFKEVMALVRGESDNAGS